MTEMQQMTDQCAARLTGFFLLGFFLFTAAACVTRGCL